MTVFQIFGSRLLHWTLTAKVTCERCSKSSNDGFGSISGLGCTVISILTVLECLYVFYDLSFLIWPPSIYSLFFYMVCSTRGKW